MRADHVIQSISSTIKRNILATFILKFDATIMKGMIFSQPKSTIRKIKYMWDITLI